MIGLQNNFAKKKIIGGDGGIIPPRHKKIPMSEKIQNSKTNQTNIHSTILLIKKFNKLTDNKFDFIRLKSVEVQVYKKTAQFVFIYPEDKIEEVEKNKGAITGHLSKLLASIFDTTIIFQKSHFDKHLFLSHVFVMLKDFPAVSKFVMPEDISVQQIDKDNIKVDINIQQLVYSYAIANKVANVVKSKLYFEYTQNFEIEFVPKALTSQQSEQMEQRQKAKQSTVRSSLEFADIGREIHVTNVQPLTANPVDSVARYISDTKVPLDNVVLCGTIDTFEERTSKKGTKFIKFVLKDFTDTINGICFFTQKNTEWLSKLKQGDEVIIRGNVEPDDYTGGGAVQFAIKDIAYCKLPTDFKINRVKTNVPEYYQTIFPNDYIDSNQADFFDDGKKLPKDIANKEFVVFDLETTGLDERTNTIIEIAAVKIVNGKLTQTFQSLIDPHVELTSNIVEITGLTDDMLKGKPDLSHVLLDFYKFCQGATLVAHNIDFDNKFLQINAKKQNIYFENPKEDTLAIAKKKVKGVKNYKLGTLCQKFEIVNEQAHRALSDAIATAKLFLQLSTM